MSNLSLPFRPSQEGLQGDKMSTRSEEERTHYLQYYQNDSRDHSGGVVEAIRTTPLFSLAARNQVGSHSPNSSARRSNPFSSHQKSAELGERPNANEEDSSNGEGTGEEESEENLPEEPSVNEGSEGDVECAILPQYGLLGFNVDIPDEPEPIMLNTNAPNSVFICGSQGSGKSYTLSCMLENCILPHKWTGGADDPIAGVVFHYDTNAAGTVAEATSLASTGIKVRVLVSRSAYHDLKSAYKAVDGSSNVEVWPLLFQDKHLTVDRINKLMAFTSSEGSMPLYMEVIQRILRQNKVDGRAFTFSDFQDQLEGQKFDRTQSSMLNMRLALLESFCASVAKEQLAKGTKNMSKKDQRREQQRQGLDFDGDTFLIAPGTLTIVDLSDPFIDPSAACVLFYICLSIINANKPKEGMVVALDEAHKYLDKATDAASIFTDQLLTTIREQRHNATRVVIATQEPTISERLLDLCSVSIVHRFTSPAWFDTIKGHLGGASRMTTSDDGRREMFERIVDLQVGESLVFSPSSFVCLDEEGKPKKLGSGVMKMKTRKRVGADAGRSVLVIRS